MNKCKCGCGKSTKMGRKGKFNLYIHGHNNEYSKERNLKISESLTGRKLTAEHIAKLSLAKKGKPSKKSKGLTNINKNIRNNLKYKAWRTSVFERDKYTCTECGKKECYLEAHHKIGLKKIIKINDLKTTKDYMSCEQLWNLDNGQTVCFECHKKIDKYRKVLNNKAKTNKGDEN